jgi:ribosomal protein L24
MLIRAGDLVEVRTGNARGTRAKVLTVQPLKGRLVVEGVNRVYRHVKKSQKNQQGGRLSKEMPIDASNVLFVCGTDDHGSTSELAAFQAGKPVREFIDGLHALQEKTLKRYSISIEKFSSVS